MGDQGEVPVTTVRNAAGEVVDVEDVLGPSPRSGRRAAGRGEEPRAERRPRSDDVWVALENQWDPSSGELVLKAGDEVSPDELVFKGEERGMARRRGGEIAVRRGAPGSPSAGSPVGEAAGGRRPERAPEGSDAVDARVLPVVFDDQGERYRPWREVVPLLEADEYADWPVEGPRTALWLMKQLSRANLGPQQWLERFLSTSRWSDTDRSVHKLKAIARYFETGGSYDQVNLAG